MWIARDKDGTLVLHFYEPILDFEEWSSLDFRILDGNLLPEVTFENSPKKVELKLVEE